MYVVNFRCDLVYYNMILYSGDNVPSYIELAYTHATKIIWILNRRSIRCNTHSTLRTLANTDSVMFYRPFGAQVIVWINALN